MGFRHYFYQVKKSDIEIVQNYTKKEYLENFEYLDLDEDDIFLNWLEKSLKVKQIFNFGKYYENSEDIENLSERLFFNEDLHEENKVFVVGKDGLLNAINYFRNEMIKYFNELLMQDEEYKKIYPYDETTREQRLIIYIHNILKEWEIDKYLKSPRVIDISEKERITESDRYEYVIFELVRLLKTIDWNEYTLLFYGW